MKKTIVIATLLALTTMVSAQEVADAKASATSSTADTTEKATQKTQRFGFLSYEEALKSMPEYATVQKSIEDLKATYDKEMERAEQEALAAEILNKPIGGHAASNRSKELGTYQGGF